MSKTFRIEIVTPDETALSTDAISLKAPAWEGYLGVLAGHAPMLAVLRPGVLTVKGERREWVFAIKGGFLDVRPTQVTVLADDVEAAESIDAGAAESAVAAAKERPLEVPADLKGGEARTRARELAASQKDLEVRWAEARRDAAERRPA